MREIAGKPFISLIPETHTIASYICSYFCSDGVTLAALACRYTYTDEMTSWRSDEEKPAIWCRGRKWSARSGSGNPTGPSERERRAMGRWRAERRRPVSRFTWAVHVRAQPGALTPVSPREESKLKENTFPGNVQSYFSYNCASGWLCAQSVAVAQTQVTQEAIRSDSFKIKLYVCITYTIVYLKPLFVIYINSHTSANVPV